MLEHTGNVFVVSAPSGTGKSTLCHRLVKDVPGLIFSTSYTTRKPRPGEADGVDYLFIGEHAFTEMVQAGGFLEWVEVYGQRYGTGRAWIEEKLQAGVDILLDIETTGAKHVHEAMPDAVMIFILPPSRAELERRLQGRRTESDEQMRLRLQRARHELEQYGYYDYLVVNDDLERAYRDLSSIVLATRSRRARTASAARRILATFA